MKRQYLIFVFLTSLYLPLTLFADDNGITGKVIDVNTGQALSGANVSIEGTKFGAATNTDGEFLIKNIPPGTYNLRITFIGYTSAQKSFSISRDEILTLNIMLQPTILKWRDVVITANRDVNRAVARETPIPFTTLSPEHLARNFTTGDLPDLIRNVPGVWYSTAGLGEPEIFLRGFAADKVRCLVNGIPMNEQDDQNLYWSNWAGLSSMVASIEVQRGPAFSLIGSGGFGGSVHIETMGITTIKATILRDSFGFYNTLGIESGSWTLW